MIIRRGSRMNTDQLPKGAPKVQTSRGSGGMLPQDIFWILTPQSPLSWVSESFRQDISESVINCGRQEEPAILISRLLLRIRRS